MERAFRLLTRVPAGPIVAIAAVAGLWVMSGAPAAAHRVPDLEGMQVNSAIARAVEEGYFTKVAWKRTGGIAGTVVDQRPVAWTVRNKGTEIVLTVTRGAAQVKVPDVRGADVEEARRRLDRGHVVPGAVSYRQDRRVRPNRVITTDPPPGALVDVGTPVDIIAAA